MVRPVARAPTVNGMADQTAAPSKPRKVPRVLVPLGGGTVGVYAARRLRKRDGAPGGRHRRRRSAAVHDLRAVLAGGRGRVDRSQARVAPHRFALPGIDSLQGKVSRIEHAARRVEITPEEGEPYWVTYDHVVVGLALSHGPCRSLGWPRSASASRTSKRPSPCATTCSAGSTSRPAPGTRPCADGCSRSRSSVAGSRDRGARRGRGHGPRCGRLVRHDRAGNLNFVLVEATHGSCQRSVRSSAATPSTSCESATSRSTCPRSSPPATGTSCCPTGSRTTSRRSCGPRA